MNDKEDFIKAFETIDEKAAFDHCVRTLIYFFNYKGKRHLAYWFGNIMEKDSFAVFELGSDCYYNDAVNYLNKYKENEDEDDEDMEFFFDFGHTMKKVIPETEKYYLFSLTPNHNEQKMEYEIKEGKEAQGIIENFIKKNT